MAFPHVFQRSGRRGERRPMQEQPQQAVVARQIAAQLGNLLERAEGADLPRLAEMIENARVEAERIAGLPESGPVPL